MNVLATQNEVFIRRVNPHVDRDFSRAEPRQNLLLAALPDCEWSRWLPHLERVEFPVGKVLCDSGSPNSFVYFPTTAIVSLLCHTVAGGTAEIAVVGNDGIVGISAITGGQSTPSQAVVQTAGLAYRLRAQLLKSELDRGGVVLQLMLRYTMSLISQVAQTAVCNRHHTIEQQLARRLLAGLDRSPSNELAMTQEALATLLGVRREGVTAAALKLQQAGVIRYQRGHISVLHRSGLEARTCECYAAVASEQHRLLPMDAALRHMDAMAIAA